MTDFQGLSVHGLRVIGVRSALRALTLLTVNKDADAEGQYALSMFRAVSAGWTVARNPNLAKHAQVSAALSGASKSDVGLIRAAALAMNASAAGSVSPGISQAVRTGIEALSSACNRIAGSEAESTFHSAMTGDLNDLVRGEPTAVAKLALWATGESPNWTAQRWSGLAHGLAATDLGWEVWTNWYEDRLAGVLRSDARELAHVEVANELWARGPAKVNAWIIRRIKELEPKPSESRAPDRPAQLEQLSTLLVTNFDEQQLDRVVKFSLGTGLFVDYAAPGSPFRTVVHDLLEKTQQRGSIVQLFSGVIKFRPDVKDAVARILPEATAAPSDPPKQVADVVEGFKEVAARVKAESPKPAPKIFISYRREDSAGHAGRVHDRLEREFGRDLLFMDVDTIPLGRNFVKILSEKVAQCDVLLAVIGPNWLTICDEQGQRRLDSPNDFVRVEIGVALKRDIPVIPVLLDGAKIPKLDQLPQELKELALRNGLDVRHSSFHSDMSRLIKGLTDAVDAEVQAAQRRKR
jgi:hypothetical protein